MRVRFCRSWAESRLAITNAGTGPAFIAVVCSRLAGKQAAHLLQGLGFNLPNPFGRDPKLVG